MEYGGRGKPYHFVAVGYIVYNKKVLLIAHEELKKWLPPGGHLKQDSEGYFVETPEESVIREVKEETGLDVEIVSKKKAVEDSEVKALFLPDGINIHEIDKKHDHLVFVYFCKPINENLKIEPSDEGRLEWFSEDDLNNYPRNSEIEMREEIRTRAKEAIRKLSGE